MKDGHPYETEDLDKTRVAQRRTLRSVPDWIVDDVKVPLPDFSSVNDPDRFLIEAELRQLAQVSEVKLRAFLDRWHKHLAPEVVRSFLRGATKEGVAAGAMSDVFEDVLAEEMATRVTEVPTERPEITRLVTLLAWADLLARDGYKDPRIANITAPS